LQPLDRVQKRKGCWGHFLQAAAWLAGSLLFIVLVGCLLLVYGAIEFSRNQKAQDTVREIRELIITPTPNEQQVKATQEERRSDIATTMPNPEDYESSFCPDLPGEEVFVIPTEGSFRNEAVEGSPRFWLSFDKTQIQVELNDGSTMAVKDIPLKTWGEGGVIHEFGLVSGTNNVYMRLEACRDDHGTVKGVYHTYIKSS
jgi:hypothetical protein